MSEIENDLFKGLGVEVDLINDNFLCVVETLTRIGISSKNEKELFQSCHILHKRGRYAIMHFKEMFILDGKSSTLSEDDILRRNTIAKLLEQWNLVKILNQTKVSDTISMRHIKIVPFKEKNQWTLVPKYTLGVKR